jgi:hypothetical protein
MLLRRGKQRRDGEVGRESPRTRFTGPDKCRALTLLGRSIEWPKAVRRLEGPYGWLKSLLDKEGILRVVEIKHALDRCLLDYGKSNPCRGIYVMGHSHEPMLKRVEFWPRTPPGKR